MTREDWLDIIESSSKENAWGLIEAEKNPIDRFNDRQLFFEALYCLKENFDLPGDTWGE